MLSEISQTEKDRYYMVSLTWGNEKKKVKLTGTENSKVVARGWGVREIGRGW